MLVNPWFDAAEVILRVIVVSLRVVVLASVARPVSLSSVGRIRVAKESSARMQEE